MIITSCTIAICLSFLVVLCFHLFGLNLSHTYCALYLFSFTDIIAQNMGCFQSTGNIDFDTIQPAVLKTRGDSARYSGTTERGRCQVSFNSSFLFFSHFYFVFLDVRKCRNGIKWRLFIFSSNRYWMLRRSRIITYTNFISPGHSTTIM
jgi:hypothetical protein